jgi:6-phosphogluconolactonase
MNLHKISRIAKVSIGSAAMVFGLASCSLDYVVGYVYMTTNKSTPGVIDQYAIDFQSGALSSIGTPVAAGTNPVRLVADPTGKFIYVVNQGSITVPGSSSVQEFAVQGDGTLVSKNTYATGTSPTAVAIDPQGKFLYVTFNYQTGTSGPGGISIFPVNADNSLGTALTQPVGNGPVGIEVSYFNHFVYVVDQETPTNAMILGFSQNTSTGALTPVPGTTITTVAGKTVATGYPTAGVPSAIAEEQTSRFLYVTDQTDNYLIGYDVAPNGSLVAMLNGPFQTGLFPVAVTVDPTGKLLYVVNYNARTVSGYAIDSSTGTPSSSAGILGTQVGVGPTCATIDPALGIFLYTSNNLDNSISGERLNNSTGTLTTVENSPFNGSGQPTCLVAVANGAHASQVIQP